MIVLDTHIWLRWVIQSGGGLPADVLAAIQSEDRVAVSAISCFEVPYLLKRRRIVLPLPVEDWLRDALSPTGIESLPVSWEIAFRSAQLPEHHRDPADRIIIATALMYDARLASLDSAFPRYTELGNRLIGP
ncbi:MAG: type II toxin-antitoxin system VapC family toxin [Candidatus Contendobacter sp.]|nr:MAG: type II toxin-antitoxin system VapC family toxin [Candidatus Contendobacter sp.]